MRERLIYTLASSGVPVDTVTGDGPGAEVTYLSDATPEQRAAGAAIVVAFDWSEQAQQQWELQRRLVQAGDQLTSLDALPIAVRLMGRVIGDRMNAWARANGFEPPLLEADVMPAIAAGLVAGLGLPSRPDV